MNSFQNDEESTPLIEVREETSSKRSLKTPLVLGGAFLISAGSIAAVLRSNTGASTSDSTSLQIDNYGQWSKRYGGGGGGDNYRQCRDGYDGFVDLFKAKGGGALDSFGLVCKGSDDKGMFGGGGGSYKDKYCPNGFDAMKIQYKDLVGKVWGKCFGDSWWSDISQNNGDWGNAKGNVEEFWCPNGWKIAAVNVRAGGMVDSVSFLCKSTYSLAPTTKPSAAPSLIPTLAPTYPDPVRYEGALCAGKALFPGDYVVNGVTQLIYQPDGNLVLYQNSVPKWNSRTVGRGTGRAEMQTDGNFVIYPDAKVTANALWWTGTSRPDSFLVVQADGNCVIYDKNYSPKWHTGTVSFRDAVVHKDYTCGANTPAPTSFPIANPSAVPTELPSAKPSALPTFAPSALPTRNPSAVPTQFPTLAPNHGQTDVYSDWSPRFGGGGGGYQELSCGTGYGGFADAMHGNGGGVVDAFGPICIGNIQKKAGGSGGSYNKVVSGAGFDGVEVQYGRFVGQISVKKVGESGFTKVTGNGDWSEGQGNKKQYYCPGGTKIFSVGVWSGSYVDALSVRCKAVATVAPTNAPVAAPTPIPSSLPTLSPTDSPVADPTFAPTESPVANPTLAPVADPTPVPISYPTEVPISDPTAAPVADPTEAPISDPTEAPISYPTPAPVADPTAAPIAEPSAAPISDATDAPIAVPSETPIAEPSEVPIATPTAYAVNEDVTITHGTLTADEEPVVNQFCALFAYHAIPDLKETPYLSICAKAGFGEIRVGADKLEEYGIIVSGKSHLSDVIPGKHTKIEIYSSPAFDGGKFGYVVHGVDKKYPPLTEVKLSNHELANDNIKSFVFTTLVE